MSDDRWTRLTENIAAGRSPLDAEILETIRANAAVNLDVPPPRVLQLVDEVERLREIERRARIIADAEDEPQQVRRAAMHILVWPRAVTS